MDLRWGASRAERTFSGPRPDLCTFWHPPDPINAILAWKRVMKAPQPAAAATYPVYILPLPGRPHPRTGSWDMVPVNWLVFRSSSPLHQLEDLCVSPWRRTTTLG